MEYDGEMSFGNISNLHKLLPSWSDGPTAELIEFTDPNFYIDARRGWVGASSERRKLRARFWGLSINSVCFIQRNKLGKRGDNYECDHLSPLENQSNGLSIQRISH